MEGLRDLADVEVDAGLPVEERVRSFAEQIGDPHHFTAHGTEVRLSFAGRVTVEEAVARLLGLGDASAALPPSGCAGRGAPPSARSNRNAGRAATT